MKIRTRYFISLLSWRNANLTNCTKRFTCEERFLHEFKKNNNKCLFSYVYALRFTVKSFKYITCNGIIKLKQRQAALRALTHLTPRYLRKALYHQTICKTIKPSNYIKGNPKIIEIINSEAKPDLRWH